MSPVLRFPRISPSCLRRRLTQAREKGGRERILYKGVGRKLLAPAPNGKRKGKRDSLYRGGRTVIRTPAHNM